MPAACKPLCLIRPSILLAKETICKKYSFIQEVIIFCGNYQYNKHYIDDYPGYVKKVLTNIDEVYNYLKTFKKKRDLLSFLNIY